MIRKIVLGLTLAALCTGAAFAQGIKRTPLQKIDFPAGYTTVTAIAEIPVGGSAGRHTHPGVETGYVIEGEGDHIIDGQPTKHLTRQAVENHGDLYRGKRQAAGHPRAVRCRTNRPHAGWIVLDQWAGPVLACPGCRPSDVGT
jgi:hypothetical protein